METNVDKFVDEALVDVLDGVEPESIRASLFDDPAASTTKVSPGLQYRKQKQKQSLTTLPISTSPPGLQDGRDQCHWP